MDSQLSENIENIESLQLTEIMERLKRIESYALSQKSHFTMAEAAEYLDVQLATLYKMTYTNVLPVCKPGKKKCYILKLDLDNWIKSARTKSADEIKSSAALRS